jgi:hypothetical protein
MNDTIMKPLMNEAKLKELVGHAMKCFAADFLEHHDIDTGQLSTTEGTVTAREVEFLADHFDELVSLHPVPVPEFAFTEAQSDKLVNLLWDSLKRDSEHSDRRHTACGTKSKAELVACIYSIIAEAN